MGPTDRVGGQMSLVSLGPEARYVEPRFSWADPVAPTGLHFNTSTRLGDEYRDDLHDEQNSILIGEGFGIITDIVTGPGGMFVLSLDGELYRIRQTPPASAMSGLETFPQGAGVVPEPAAYLLYLTSAMVLTRSRSR